MRRILSDLTFSDYAGGLGPLALAAVCGWRAARSDVAFDRGVWIAVSVIMVVICVIYVSWSLSRRPAREN